MGCGLVSRYPATGTIPVRQARRVEIQRFGQNFWAPRRSSLASRTSRRDRRRNKSATSGSSSNYQNADAQCFPRGSVGHWRGRRTVNSAYDPSSLSHFVSGALCQFGRDGVAVVGPRDRADPDCNPVGHRDGLRRRSGYDAARRETGEADRLNRQNTGILRESCLLGCGCAPRSRRLLAVKANRLVEEF